MYTSGGLQTDSADIEVLVSRVDSRRDRSSHSDDGRDLLEV